jgi:DNA-binding CsgD family transcriptional regulator
VSHKEALQNMPAAGTYSNDTQPAEPMIDADRRLVFVKFGKSLTFADVESYIGRLQANPVFESNFSEIVDLSDVVELNMRAEDFLKLADEIDPFAANARRAFIARSSVQNHVARMNKILRGNKNIEIFRTMDEAEQWIHS